MKKGILILAILGIACFLLVRSIQAASTVNISSQAVVPNSTPEIAVTILKFTDGNPDNDPWTGSTTVTSMDFGTLVHNLADGSDAGLWFSNAGFCVVIYAQGFGHKYDIKSTCAGLTSGTNSLPTGCFGLTPVYSQNDQWCWGSPPTCVAQGAMPATAVLGTAGSAIATNKLIYTSEASPSTARILQAYYGIPPKATGGADPFTGHVGIPLNQPAGTYTGTVTITIAAI